MDNIIKQGYLKKSRPTAPGSNPANSFLQLFEPTRWFVFGLRNRRPYLEYYEKEHHAFSAQAINSFDLYTCTKVTYTLGRNNRNWTFCLFLPDRILELTAESRDVMLSWCRTLEHTLQSYGALKHVPSEHIYSDYPVKYKPKRSASPIENRSLTIPTPPPSEPAPPIPGAQAENGFATSSGKTGPIYSNSDISVLRKESEVSETDTSEDDFVDERFFQQKKMEAFASRTLKLDSRSENPLALETRLAATLPSRSIPLPMDTTSIPELPARPSRDKTKESTKSLEDMYSKVNKLTQSSLPGEESVYEVAFDIRDLNKDDEKSQESASSDSNDEGVYEATFDVKETQPLVQKRHPELSVELPQRKSKFSELDRISKNLNQNGLDENLYSDFNSVISSKIQDDVLDGSCFINHRGKNSEISETSNGKKDLAQESSQKSIETATQTESSFILKEENNKQEEIKSDLKMKVDEKTMVENMYDNIGTSSIPDNVQSSKLSGSNSYVTLSYETNKNSPVKPPRKVSRKSDPVEACYANIDTGDKNSKLLNDIPAVPKPQAIRENIYDFGKCIDPIKSTDKNVDKLSTEKDYDNLQPQKENRKSKQDRYCKPPPLKLESEYKRSDSYSPDTSRKTPTNLDPISSKAGLLNLPPSPSSPSTPVNEPNFNLPTSYRSVVGHSRDSTPSPKLHYSRKKSHSPKNRHSDILNQSTQVIPKLPARLSDPPKTTRKELPDDLPQSVPFVPKLPARTSVVPNLPKRENVMSKTCDKDNVLETKQAIPNVPSRSSDLLSVNDSKNQSKHNEAKLVSSDIAPELPPRPSDSSNLEKSVTSTNSRQERPRSLEMSSNYDVVKSQHVRKNTGEALYSPVMNRNWFGSQPMPGVGFQPITKAEAKPNVSSQPPLQNSIDTTYEVPKSSRPVIQHEPQPTFFSRNLVNDCGSSSPSHDGFEFNIPDDKEASKDVVEDGDNNDEDDDDDEETHAYEDATGMHGEPPLPPPRRSRPSLPDRSKSVYIPCNISQDPSRVIVRQTSLRERQRITSAPGLVTVLPLKQSEIDILREEQQSHGIIVKITPAACQKIALVDCLNGVWIVGWDFKHYPRLSESIHIGDEVTKVNDIRVTSAQMARKTIKSCNTEQVDLVIKRLPYAHVMAICRSRTGEKLGLQRLGGTAEITYVDPAGLSAQHGLPKHAKCVSCEGFCNWWITEINNRPVNLTFKGDEIEHKLNAVGKDISIVVHPSDFIKELKKQLKKMRNSKDFLAIS